MEDVIIPNQYGFRQDRTAIDCLVDLFNEIAIVIRYALTLFLDLSRVFDTVNLSILRANLALSVIEVENLCFRSYFQNRNKEFL